MAHRYHAVQDPAHFLRQFGVQPPPVPTEIRAEEQGVFVRRPRTDVTRSGKLPRLEAARGRWGLIPLFSPDGLDRMTHEAACESAATERNFYQPWKRSHRCVVLVDAAFESTDAGGEVRIERFDHAPFCIAGLWNGWRSPEGACVESFAMLTIDAAEDALMHQLEGDRPRRRPVVLPDGWVDEWLHAPLEETSTFLRPYPLQMRVTEMPKRFSPAVPTTPARAVSFG